MGNVLVPTGWAGGRENVCAPACLACGGSCDAGGAPGGEGVKRVKGAILDLGAILNEGAILYLGAILEVAAVCRWLRGFEERGKRKRFGIRGKCWFGGFYNGPPSKVFREGQTVRLILSDR